MPRKPSKLTRLGRLRRIAGCDGKALASDARISYQLLKMIETGARRMTEGTAKKIARATGVSSLWLLGNGLKSKPTTDRSTLEKFSGEVFTKEYFASTRARIESRLSLKTLEETKSFCRIEASGRARMLQITLEHALHCAVQFGEQNRVLDIVDDCLQAIESYMKTRQPPMDAQFYALPQGGYEWRRPERKSTPARSAKTFRPRQA